MTDWVVSCSSILSMKEVQRRSTADVLMVTSYHDDIQHWGENGVIRGSEGRYMDRLNRAGLNFNLAGSVWPETDYFFSRFLRRYFFSKLIFPNYFPTWGFTPLLLLLLLLLLPHSISTLL